MLATVSEITEPRDIYSKLFFSVVDEEVSLVVSRQVLIDIVEKLKSLPDEQAISAAKCLLVRIQPRVISFEEQVSGAEVVIRKMAGVLLEWLPTYVPTIARENFASLEYDQNLARNPRSYSGGTHRAASCDVSATT